MTTFIEYELEDGATVLIESGDDVSGMVHASRGEGLIIPAKERFAEAFKDAKKQARLLLREIEELNVNDAEVKFGLTTWVEIGNLAIGKTVTGVNYEVTLKWKKIEKQKS
jgi:hypothetical protein